MRNLQNSHFFYRKNEKNRIRQIRSLDAVLSKGSHSKIPLFSREINSKSNRVKSGAGGCWTGAACWLAFTRRALYVAGISVFWKPRDTFLQKIHWFSIGFWWSWIGHRDVEFVPEIHRKWAKLDSAISTRPGKNLKTRYFSSGNLKFPFALFFEDFWKWIFEWEPFEMGTFWAAILQ